MARRDQPFPLGLARRTLLHESRDRRVTSVEVYMTSNRFHRSSGFSLIELLVVTAIILIIMGMAMPQLQQAKRTALEAEAIKAVTTIHTAHAQYQSQYGRLASTLAELE